MKVLSAEPFTAKVVIIETQPCVMRESIRYSADEWVVKHGDGYLVLSNYADVERAYQEFLRGRRE
jgi:hypothetical protein